MISLPIDLPFLLTQFLHSFASLSLTMYISAMVSLWIWRRRSTRLQKQTEEERTKNLILVSPSNVIVYSLLFHIDQLIITFLVIMTLIIRKIWFKRKCCHIGTNKTESICMIEESQQKSTRVKGSHQKLKEVEGSWKNSKLISRINNNQPERKIEASIQKESLKTRQPTTESISYNSLLLPSPPPFQFYLFIYLFDHCEILCEDPKLQLVQSSPLDQCRYCPRPILPSLSSPPLPSFPSFVRLCALRPYYIN